MGSPSDKILIHQLEVSCILGVTEEERRLPQKVLIDLELCGDLQKAAKSDQIDDAIDYDRVCKVISRFIESSSFHLLEALAEGVADLIFKKFPVDQLRLRIFKPRIIKNVKEVGVEIYRVRRKK